MKTENLHPFEIAGLGESPFRFVGLRRNVYSAAPGHSQPGGTCDFCGQGIMYECAIQSRDGERFVVGMDCVLKLDRADNRLVASVKRAKLNLERAKRQAERDAKWAAQNAAREAKLQAQRDANGGLTDAEVAEKIAEAERLKESAKWVAENGWLLEVLDREYQSEFIRGMIQRLESGSVAGLSPRMASILTDIYAKSFGRRGSKKYDAAVAEFETKLGIIAE
jgi:hypothetical protein